MIWFSTLSAAPRLEDAIRETGDRIREVFEEVGYPDLAIVFVSGLYPELGPELGAEVLAWSGARRLLGCTAHGVIGGGVEVLDRPALAVTAARFEDVRLSGFHLAQDQLPGEDSPPSRWRELLDIEPEPAPHFVLLPESTSMPVERVCAGLDYAYPSSIKIGGAASGDARGGRNLLFLDASAHEHGLVGLALSGALSVNAVLEHGCRPIGRTMRITRARGQRIEELDGRPAQDLFLEIFAQLPREERLQVQRRRLFLGVSRSCTPGEPPEQAYLIRHLMGFEREGGAMITDAEVRAGMALRLHLRDEAAARRELRQVLGTEAGGALRGTSQGALLFSFPEHAAGTGGDGGGRALAPETGSIPLGGLLGSEEIGPVGDATLLHGYTSSFGIFRKP